MKFDFLTLFFVLAGGTDGNRSKSVWICFSSLFVDFQLLTCYRESKRKTPTIVLLKDDERLFGDAAAATVRDLDAL